MRRKNKNTEITASITSPVTKNEIIVEPMDEDEQQALVKKLDSESTQQQAQFDQLFRYLCTVAALLCILGTAYVHRKTSNRRIAASSSSVNESISKTTSHHHLTLFRWTHGVLASLLHLLSIRILCVRTSLNVLTCHLPVILNLLVASVALFSARNLKSSSSKQDELLLTTMAASDDDNTVKQRNAAIFLHYGLVISNLLVLCAALLLRWDAQATEKALQELKDARYRHKSL